MTSSDSPALRTALRDLVQEELAEHHSEQSNYCWWCHCNVNGIDGPKEPHAAGCWFVRAQAALLDAAPPSAPLAALQEAGRALYLAGRWECPAVSDDEAMKLWTALRDALGLPVGTATALDIGAPPSREQQEDKRPPSPREEGTT